MRDEVFSRSHQREWEREREVEDEQREREAAPCSPHAVVVSLCGGELYCFPLVLSQSNNLLCCPRSLSSDSFMYDCYVYGRFWSISAMFWMVEPAVCQPPRSRPCSSSRQRDGGWSSPSSLDGCGPAARTASSYWCHRGFSGINTRKDVCSAAAVCFCRTTASRSTVQTFPHCSCVSLF